MKSKKLRKLYKKVEKSFKSALDRAGEMAYCAMSAPDYLGRPQYEALKVWACGNLQKIMKMASRCANSLKQARKLYRRYMRKAKSKR